MTFRLYTGYFDDFGCRKGMGISDPAEVEQHLLDLAICGDPILINDGYCFSNQGLWSLLEREAKAENTTTVLGVLFETGFAKTLARKTFVRTDGQVVGNFAEAFEAMVNGQAWPGGRKDHWLDPANVAEMKSNLENLNDRRFHTSYGWPKTDKDAVYLRLWNSAMAEFASSNPYKWRPNVVADLRSLLNNLPTDKISRTKVESDVIRQLERMHPNTLIPLWDLANQAYHMTFAAWVQHGIPQDGERFGVTSRYPRYFERFVKKSEATGKENFKIELNLPIINASNPVHLGLLRQITTCGETLCSAKEAALSLTRGYLAGTGHLREVTTAWKAYAAKLSDAFAGKTAAAFVRTESIDQNSSTVEVSQSVERDQHRSRTVGLDLTNGHFTGHGLVSSFLSPMLLQLEYRELDERICWSTIAEFA